jgi:hypothetical protein
MKRILLTAYMLALASHAHAANTSANHGHHGGGNNGALGSAAHGNSSAAAGAAQSGSEGGNTGDCDMAHYTLCSKGN